MDIRTLSRVTAVASLIIGPLAMAIPTTYTESGAAAAGQLKLAAAHMGQAGLANAMLLPALFIVPAMIYAARLARGRAPRLAFIGGGISALAWFCGIAGVGAVDLMVYHGVGVTDRAAVADLIDRVTGDPVNGTLTVLFVLGHVIGMVVLGIALWRSRAVPVWGAAVFILYPIVHIAAHVIGSVALDNASGILLFISGLVCAVAVLRKPNAEWDLPTVVEHPAESVAEPVPARL